MVPADRKHLYRRFFSPCMLYMNYVMNYVMNYYFHIILVIVAGLALWRYGNFTIENYTDGIETFVDGTGSPNSNQLWHRDNTCKFQMIEVLRNMIKANNLNRGTDDNWSVYLPCGYNYSQQELEKLKPTSEDQKIFIIKGCDNLSRKDNVWEHLERKYGVKEAAKIMPRTYVLTSPDNVTEFRAEYSPQKVYILKKNIQRQEGLKMTQDFNEIINGLRSGYVVAQEMLQDPYKIGGHKTNCRVYLLVVCKGTQKQAYIYMDGFMYYTPKEFKPNSMEKDHVITTGYIDREIYEKYPLTLRDFAAYLDTQGMDGKEIFTKTGKMLAKTLDAVSPSICTKSNVMKQTTFQLFGCDVAFNDKMEAQLIEINKGPDLGGKDEKDKKLKTDMVEELFALIGVGDKKPSDAKNFLRIW